MCVCVKRQTERERVSDYLCVYIYMCVCIVYTNNT